MMRPTWGAALFVMVACGQAVAEQPAATVRGVLQPLREARLSVDFSQPISQLPLKEGEAFRKGQVLVAFDCARFAAELKAQRAAWRARRLELAGKRRLLQHQAAGRFDVSIARAKAQEAAARVAVVKSRLAKCTLRAPWDGVVAERLVKPHETPQAGAPLLAIVASGGVEVEMIAPAKWLAWVRPGFPFSFRVDETGQMLKGVVTRVGAVVDKVSQTVRLHGLVRDVPNGVRPGMGGTATFERDARLAAGEEGGS